MPPHPTTQVSPAGVLKPAIAAMPGLAISRLPARSAACSRRDSIRENEERA